MMAAMPIRLLYLMFARICAWLVLLGRSTASKGHRVARAAA
jgi:hypothetical protein